MGTEDGKARRAAAREKYGPQLKESFKALDKDGSGFASVEEMTKHMVEKGMIKPGAREADFVKSLVRFSYNLRKTINKICKLSQNIFKISMVLEIIIKPYKSVISSGSLSLI